MITYMLIHQNLSPYFWVCTICSRCGIFYMHTDLSSIEDWLKEHKRACQPKVIAIGKEEIQP